MWLKQDSWEGSPVHIWQSLKEARRDPLPSPYKCQVQIFSGGWGGRSLRENLFHLGEPIFGDLAREQKHY